MAKKLGKLLLFSAVTGAVAAGVYYYLNKKEDGNFDDEDYENLDDFDLAEDDTAASRNYVSLDLGNSKTDPDMNGSETIFDQESNTVSSSSDNQIEEFFDEDDNLSDEYLEKTDATTD